MNNNVINANQSNRISCSDCSFYALIDASTGIV